MDNSKVTFDDVRTSIVEYLSSNPTFKDYNFTAPAISTLIDALAYTSHYLMRYANFAINECFLDSAQLRHNVVSKAKNVAYIPYQYSAAKAKIRLTLANSVDIPEGTKVPEGTLFTATSANGTSYTFRSIGQKIFEKDSNNRWFVELDIIEGTFVEEDFTQDYNYKKRFYLLNNNVDTEYMTVIVEGSTTDEKTVEYQKADSVASFGPEACIYYLEEAYNGQIELYFGDGILSRKLPPYSKVYEKYLVTNGSVANNIIEFNLSNAFLQSVESSNIKIEVIEASHSGADRESIESIKFNAPKFYQRQDRNVTTTDYNAAVVSQYGGWIDAITSWGGEDNEPPQYAKIFICIKPKYTQVLSPGQKEKIVASLASKNLPCVEPVIVDPQYINVILNLEVEWEPYKTARDKDDIVNIITETTNEFFKTNIVSFKSAFKYSKYLTELSALDVSIDSILSDITLKQYLTPDTTIKSAYTFEFLNKLKEGSLCIGPWNISGSLDEYRMIDSNGVVVLTTSSGRREDVGTIDYAKGSIRINGYKFDAGSPSMIPVVVSPYAQNINLAKNYLLTLDTLNVSVNEKTEL